MANETIVKNSPVGKHLENVGKKTELVYGYLSHLVQDRIWFGEYMKRYVKRKTGLDISELISTYENNNTNTVKES